MYLIPSVKKLKIGEKKPLTGCTLVFPEDCDERLLKIAKKVPNGDTIVNVTVGTQNSDEYKITFGDTIEIDAKGTKGAKGAKL